MIHRLIKRSLALATAILCAAACGLGSNEEKPKSAEASKAADSSQDPSTEETQRTNGSAVQLTFGTDINPILNASCGGAICHGKGSSYGVYTDREDLFLAGGAEILHRITSDDKLIVMPKYGFPMTLKSTDRTKLVNFLKQSGIVDGAAPSQSNDPGTSSGGSSSSTGPAVVVQPKKLCGSVTTQEKQAGLAMTFTQVTAIFTPSCGGAGCHVGALPHGFVGRPEALDDRIYSAGIVADIQNGSMPKGRSMTTADKNAVIAYLCARYDF